MIGIIVSAVAYCKHINTKKDLGWRKYVIYQVTFKYVIAVNSETFS